MKHSHDCHGCLGIQPVTPRVIHNRAGLPVIDYRVGTHAGFLETMLARIAELATANEVRLGVSHLVPKISKGSGLGLLSSRDLDDPSIAILDSWSLIADVLSFYQERYQNEAYLRTSVERRSIQQLANLVGYKLRPGLSSSVYLAFTVDDSASEALIPAGTQAKSTPSPDSSATSQTFETSEDFLARPLWNEMRPRLTVPHDFSNAQVIPKIYLKGTGHRIKKNDLIAIQPIRDTSTELRFVTEVAEFPQQDFTEVCLFTELGEAGKLFENVDKLTQSFIQNELGKLSDETKKDNVEKKLKDELRRIRQELVGPQSLAKVDYEIEQKLVKKQILGAIKQVFDNDSNELSKVFQDFSIDHKQSIYQQYAKTFFRAAEKARSSLNDWLQRLEVLKIEGDETQSELSYKAQNALESLKCPVPVFFKYWHPNIQVVKADESPFKSFDVRELDTDQLNSQFLEGELDELEVTVVATEKLSRNGNIKFGTVELTDNKGDSVAKYIHNCRADNLGQGVKNALSDIKIGEPRPGAIYATISKVDGFNSDIKTPLLHTVVIVNPDSNSFLEELSKKPNRDLLAENSSGLELAKSIDIESSKSVTVKLKTLPILGKVIKPNSLGKLMLGAAELSEKDDIKLEEFSTVFKELRWVGGVGSFVTVLFEFFEGDKRIGMLKRTIGVQPANERIKSKLFNDLGQAIALGELEDFIKAKKNANEFFKSNLAKLNIVIDSQRLGVYESLLEEKGLDESVRSDNPLPNPDENKVVKQLADAADKISSSIPEGSEMKIGKFIQDSVKPGSSVGDAADFSSLDSGLEELNRSLASNFSSLAERVLGPFAISILTALNSSRKDFIEDARLTRLKENFEGYDRFKRLVDHTDRYLADYNNLVALLDGLVNTASSLDGIQQALGESASLLPFLFATASNGDVGNEINSGLALLDTSSELDPSTVSLKAIEALSRLKLAIAKISTLKIKNVSGHSETSFLQRIFGSDGSAARLLEQLGRVELGTLLSDQSNLFRQVQSLLAPEDQAMIFDQMRRYRVPDDEPAVSVFRSTARLFGWNAPETVITATGPIEDPERQYKLPSFDFIDKQTIRLDGEIKQTTTRSLIAYRQSSTSDMALVSALVSQLDVEPFLENQVAGPSTKLKLESEFWNQDEVNIKVLRQTLIWCDAEELPLAEIPLDRVESKRSLPQKETLELDAAHPELSNGAKITLEATTLDSFKSEESDFVDSEVFEVVSISHTDTASADPAETRTLFGDRIRTVLTLNRPIRENYIRNTVRVCANVVEATHGGKVVDVLGGGNGRKAFQEFPLKDGPLSRVPAETELGHRDELEVRVNNVKWDQTERISDTIPEEIKFELVSTLDENYGIRFGDGENAARLPTGDENVRSVYRVGMGLDGNVDRDRIDQLPSPPFGLKAVRNPIRASGGADPDTVYQSRYRTSLAAASMQRLVSLKDYENFALMFAGVDKAKVIYSGDAFKVYVAGPFYEALPVDAALIRNLKSAITRQSDGELIVNVEPHVNMLLFIFAGVKIDEKYVWEDVHAKIRRTLLEQFGYARANFDSNVHSSDVIATIQSVEGVVYVDLDAFAGILGKDVKPESIGQDTNSRRADSDSGSRDEPPDNTEAANPLYTRASAVSEIQVSGNVLCFLTPSIPNTLRIERR